MLTPRLTLFVVLILSSLISLSSSDHLSSQQDGHQPANKPLSILMLHSMLPSHQLSVIALGAELVRRGHKVTLMGPTLEGYEHLNTLKWNLNIAIIKSNVVSKETYNQFTRSSQHNGSAFQWMYNMTQFFTSFSTSEDNYLIKMRETIDKINQSNFNYIISEQATMSIMYYAQRKWSMSNIMLLMVILDTTPRYLIPWPYPSLILSSSNSYDLNMESFVLRFINTVFLTPLEKLLIPLAGSIFVAESITCLPFDSPLDSVLYQPVLYNSVIGIERTRTLLPLHHYIGPLFLPSSPPLEQELEEWINNNDKEGSEIIFISMGTTAEVTQEMAQALLSLSTNYRLVWSLRESNNDILTGLSYDSYRVYISSWISQFTLLQHTSVRLAILHCGLNGVQESLYNKVPVLCVPYGMDQYAIADRLVYLKLGLSLSVNDISTPGRLSDTVHDILVTNALVYSREVSKISQLYKASGGVQEGANLVELYSEIGYEHGIPSFIRYQWSSVQYYNIDVWLVIICMVICCLWLCNKYCSKYCCCCCCGWVTKRFMKRKRD